MTSDSQDGAGTDKRKEDRRADDRRVQDRPTQTREGEDRRKGDRRSEADRRESCAGDFRIGYAAHSAGAVHRCQHPSSTAKGLCFRAPPPRYESPTGQGRGGIGACRQV